SRAFQSRSPPRKRPSGWHWSSRFTATIEQPTSINSTSSKDDARDRRQPLVDSCGAARSFVDHPQSRQLASQCSSDARDFRADRCTRIVDPGVFIDAANARFPLCSQFHLVHFWRERTARSEEHTSELQSRSDLVCRLL